MKKFDQKINEMLVVLNAIKKKPHKCEDKGACCADPVTCAMNDALKSLGFNVVDKADIRQPEPEGDPLDDIEGRVEDLDLPRPADDEGEDDDNGDGDDDGGDEGNPFDPLGGMVDSDDDGVEDDEGENDDNGDDNSDDNGDFGGEGEDEPEENGGVEDETDSGEMKIKRLDNGDVAFSFDGKTVTVTKDNLSQIIDFLKSEDESDADGNSDDGGEDEGQDDLFGSDSEDDED